MLCSKTIATKLRGVGDKFATGSRHPRWLCDQFARNLSHKIFEHVQNFRDYFAPLGDTCEEITNQWRLFGDCFATHSLCLSPAVAVQWDRGLRDVIGNTFKFKCLYAECRVINCLLLFFRMYFLKKNLSGTCIPSWEPEILGFEILWGQTGSDLGPNYFAKNTNGRQ